MHSPNKLECALDDYYKTLGQDRCDACAQCNREIANLSKPVGAWVVGDQFGKNGPKVLFIGKNARGFQTDKEFINFWNHSRPASQESEGEKDWCLWDAGWPYWSYTREITRLVFNDDSIENIAFTNIVKCNASDTIDTTTYNQKCRCIMDIRIIGHELEIIKPDCVVFYTARDYDSFIPSVFDEAPAPDSATRKIGNKLVPWFEGIGSVSGCRVRFLRTGHPQYKNKTDFTTFVAAWIKNAMPPNN